jgi:hypothetical protein
MYILIITIDSGYLFDLYVVSKHILREIQFDFTSKQAFYLFYADFIQHFPSLPHSDKSSKHNVILFEMKNNSLKNLRIFLHF